MIRAIVPLIMCGIMAACAVSARAADGVVRLSWDNCDPVVVHKCYLGEGSGQVATLVLSITNCDVPNNGHRTQVLIGPNPPDAWRFDENGCQAGNLDVSHAGAGGTCPAFQGERSLGLNRISFRSDRNYEWLDIANTYDEFLPVDTQRYVLWRARFDLSLTSGGDGDPTQLCGFASSPLCFIIASDWTELLSVEGTKLPLQLENDWVTWENENYEVYCVPTQAQQSTWGRVKGLYR